LELCANPVVVKRKIAAGRNPYRGQGKAGGGTKEEESTLSLKMIGQRMSRKAGGSPQKKLGTEKPENRRARTLQRSRKEEGTHRGSFSEA